MSNNTTLETQASGTSGNNQLATLKDMFKTRMPALKGVMARHMSAERLTRIVVACVSRTPLLRQCNVDSVFRASVQAAEMGLEPGSALGEAYLVPYRNKSGGYDCQLIPGYRGLISLAYRSGQVKSITAHCVFQGDQFDFELGLSPVIKHVPSPEGDKSSTKLTYVYCVVHLQDGGLLYDVMTRSEVDAIRGRSKASSSGPWVTDYNEMARKTVTRRTLKYAPMSVEMQKALALDAAAEDPDMSVMPEFDGIDPDVIDHEEPQVSETAALKDRIKGRGKGEPEPVEPAQVVDESTGEIIERIGTPPDQEALV